MNGRTRSAAFTPRLKIGSAAAYLGISRRFLHQLAQDGVVPFYRLGPRCVVFDRADLDKFLAARRIGEALP